jgi:hypothetical protein
VAALVALNYLIVGLVICICYLIVCWNPDPPVARIDKADAAMEKSSVSGAAPRRVHHGRKFSLRNWNTSRSQSEVFEYRKLCPSLEDLPTGG